VELEFATLRHNKRLARFNPQGQAKVNAQWHLPRALIYAPAGGRSGQNAASSKVTEKELSIPRCVSSQISLSNHPAVAQKGVSDQPR
jgi:hypothetical protein